MKPTINNTTFGSITIDNKVYDKDVIINRTGEIAKRNKKLSKAIYGTSHIISSDEAKHVYEEGAELLIIGAGQYSAVELSEEAEAFFKEKNCKVILQATSKATEIWNKAEENKTIGLFHITC